MAAYVLLSIRQNDIATAKMALTREFRETIWVRAGRDPAFRKALFTEALNAYLIGDEVTGKAVLKDLINATIGFEELARLVDKQEPLAHARPQRQPNGRDLPQCFTRKFRVARVWRGQHKDDVV